MSHDGAITIDHIRQHFRRILSQILIRPILGHGVHLVRGDGFHSVLTLLYS
jgi:hypothetical protein